MPGPVSPDAPANPLPNVVQDALAALTLTPSLCSSYREELEERKLDWLAKCPLCDIAVGRHARWPALPAPIAAAPASTVPRAPSAPTTAVLKRLSDMSPKWSKSAICRTFLERVELVLQPAADNGECDKAFWSMVLVTLMPADDVSSATWIRKHIVDTKLDWDAAKVAFTAHFELCSRSVTLKKEYRQLKQGKTETVQAFADRFVDLVAQLGLQPDHELVIDHFVDNLSDYINRKYEEHVLNRQMLLDDPTFRFTQLDKIITICIRLDVAQKTAASRSGSVPSAGSASGAASSSSHTSGAGGGDKKAGKPFCKNHPGLTSHTTAECRMGKAPGATASGTTTGAPRPEPRSDVKKEFTGKCFKCGGQGHLANDPNCPGRATAQAGGAATSSSMPSSGYDALRRSARIAEQKSSGANVSVSARAAFVAGLSDVEQEERDGDTSDHDAIATSASASPSIRASTVLDRTLPPAVFSPSAGGHKVLFLYEGIPYDCLLDTGCNASCIDAGVAGALGLPIQAKPGTVQLAHAGVTVERVGTTAPMSVIAVFPAPQLKMPVKEFSHAFEIMPLAASEYQFIIGMDLVRVLFPTGIPPAFFPGGAQQARPGPLPVSLAVINTADDEVSAGQLDIAEVSASLNELSQFEGMGQRPNSELPQRAVLALSPALAASYTAKRAQVMDHPDIQAALAVNAGVTGFCNLPESVVRLEVDPAKEDKLFRKQYPVAQQLRSRVSTVINNWFTAGKIELAPPGCQYNNPLTVAPKKDDEGNLTGIRVCVDTRVLNQALVGNLDKFQIPGIPALLEQLGGNSIFGEFDLQEAYLQFRMDEESKKYTAFTWDGVQYVFVGAPFGISTLPSHFQRVMSVAFSDLPFTSPYLDNLPFASKTWEEHREQALIIITRLNQLNLKIKPSSVKIGYSQIRCLGHQVSGSGVSIDPDKLKAVNEWPRPMTGEQMQSFLGFVTFLRGSVRHFADLTAPLEAVKNNKDIEWTPLLVHHFELTKQALARAPFLKFPDFSRPFHIATDASNTGVGGVLYQPDTDDGEITATNIVVICSKKLTESQRNYPAYKKELWGVVYCLRQFHPYIYGRGDLVLHTDHKPLTYMFLSEQLSPALQQWLDVLLDYSFEIRYRPGIFNVLPDALSREFVSLYKNNAWGIPASVRKIIGDDSYAEGDAPPPPGFEPSAPAVAVRVAQAVSSAAGSPSSGVGEGNAPASSDTDSDDEEAKVHVDIKSVPLAIQLERRGKISPASDEEKRALIDKEHLFGHFGREAIYKALDKKGYWWPKMRAGILSVLASCDACTRFVVTKRGYNPAEFITAGGPWDHIQIDCSVHLPASKDGYTAMLVIIDVFTGFIQLRPMRTTSAECVAQELWSLFCIFGLPKIVQSDNGPEFVNNMLRALVKLTGIDHRFISPYNPRADGKVERSIQTVMSIIKKLLHGSENHWPLFVPFAQLSFNNKVSSLTGSDPFSLMFGRSMNDIKDYTGVVAGSDPAPISLDNWKAHQEKVLSVIRPAVSDRTVISKQKMIATLNKHRKVLLPDAFPNGSIVMLTDPLRSTKFEPKYIGPYTVTRRSRNGAYALRDSTGDMLDRHVPPDQLKLVSRKARPIDLENNVYEVQSIVGHRGSPGAYEYDVKWKDLNDRSWEPASSFQDDLVIKNYWKQLRAVPALPPVVPVPVAPTAPSANAASAAQPSIGKVSSPPSPPLLVSAAAAAAAAASDAAAACVREVASAAAGRGNSVTVVGGRGAGGRGAADLGAGDRGAGGAGNGAEPGTSADRLSGLDAGAPRAQ
jgi:hypothetical protein